jgi:ubiquinone/menaquinone biosynthesis C-methylase UbiE
MGSSRRFLLGMAVGLSAGGVLRGMISGGFGQDAIRRTYRVWAPIYKLADVYLLGQLTPLRRAAIHRLRLRPGDSVLEIACGTGANLPHLEGQVGPSGRVVGVDYTPAMLARASHQVEQEGWGNVELVEADAAELDLGEQFDGVLWMLAASVIPDWQDALERAVAHVKPGGWLVLADARCSERWYTLPFQWLADLLSLGAAADIGRRPWERLPRYLTNVRYGDFLLGYLYVAYGQRPGKETGNAESGFEGA